MKPYYADLRRVTAATYRHDKSVPVFLRRSFVSTHLSAR